MVSLLQCGLFTACTKAKSKKQLDSVVFVTFLYCFKIRMERQNMKIPPMEAALPLLLCSKQMQQPWTHTTSNQSLSCMQPPTVGCMMSHHRLAFHRVPACIQTNLREFNSIKRVITPCISGIHLPEHKNLTAGLLVRGKHQQAKPPPEINGNLQKTTV